MSNQICPKCGTNNPAGMLFCSNCGQTLNAPPPEEPPPTVFISQPPPVIHNQPVFTPSAPQVSSNPPPKKSGKAWMFGIAGCLGLLVISVVGLVILVFALGYNSDILSEKKNTNINYPSPTPKTNSNSKPVFNAKPLVSDSPDINQTDDDTDSDSDNFLVTILEARKQVGAFNQTSAKSLVTKDYFPQAEGAAQAEYSNGSKFVYLTVGSFGSLSAAKQNFNDQIQGIKSGGGKVTYENTASDGTISAIYNNKGFYFAEYCNTNKFCNRIHSDNQAALKSFFEEYAK